MGIGTRTSIKMITKIQRGSDSRKNWTTINEIVDALAGAKTQNSERRGAVAYLRRRPRDVEGGAGVSVLTLKVKQLFTTYLRCRTWDGTTEGSTDIYVAKPPILRAEPDFGEDDEAHQVDPPYEVDGIIWAAEVDYTGVSTYTHIDLNVDGRVWLTQTVGCDAGGTPQYAFFHRTAWSATPA